MIGTVYKSDKDICDTIFTGWKPIQHGLWIDGDIESSPVEIKTNSLLGSDEEVKFWFFTSVGVWTGGGVTLHFKSTVMFYLPFCMGNFKDFPIELPTETDKVWRITLTKTSDIRLVIHCNNIEVLDILMSNYCNDNRWITEWTTGGKMIRFGSGDKASDFYRGKQF